MLLFQKEPMPEKERKIHILTELLAVVMIAPYLIWLSWNIHNITKHTINIHKNILLLIAIMTIIVDGYLLVRWYTF